MGTASSTKDLQRNLGKKELFGIAMGQVIGAGIMALMGIGIGMTGRSVSFAFILSSIWVILLTTPYIFISSTIRLRGGEYTQAAVLVGEKFAGFYIFLFLIRNLHTSLYSIAFADYWVSLFPGASKMIVAIIVATIFFIINVFPTKFITKVQNFIVLILVAALGIFVVSGFPQVQPGYFENPGFVTQGLSGFLQTSAFLTFATFGASSIFQLSGESKNPKTDIPIVMIGATVLVAFVYALVGVVASGVLPIEQVSNQNLTQVAEAILSRPLFLFFIVGGALGAIASTLNATIAWVTKPLLQAAEDGWLPKSFAYLHPKYKTPTRLLLLYYVITIIPIVLNIDMDQISSSVLILMYAVMIVIALATRKLPELFPEQWKESPFHCNQRTLDFFCILAAIVLLIQIYYNAIGLNRGIFIANGVFLVLAIIFANLRHKSGKVNMEISYEDD